MASPQCLGYSRYRVLTKEICFPVKENIVNHTQKVVIATGAKSVFVATDNDPMLAELEAVLQEVCIADICSLTNSTVCGACRQLTDPGRGGGGHSNLKQNFCVVNANWSIFHHVNSSVTELIGIII